MFCNRVTQCVKNKDDTFSCFTLKELKDIAISINKTERFEPIAISSKKSILYNRIKTTLKDVCDTDTCWLKQSFIENIEKDKREKLKYFTYKPFFITDGNKYKWLSQSNINNVVRQLVYKKKNIIFLGAHPSDIHLLYKLDYDKMKVSDKTFIVFNTDGHDKPGKHWVSVCIDNKKKLVEFFDSTGGKPNNNIKKFMEKFKDYQRVYSKTEHQVKDSECGMYSIYYIILKLKNYSLDMINKKIIKDRYMNDSRKCVFNMM